MSDALGVGAFLVTADRHVVLLRRALHLAEAPGLWDIPGGHPEPKACFAKFTIIYSTMQQSTFELYSYSS